MHFAWFGWGGAGRLRKEVFLIHSDSRRRNSTVFPGGWQYHKSNGWPDISEAFFMLPKTTREVCNLR